MRFLNPHFSVPSISQQATNTNSADKSVSSVRFALQKPRKLANVWRDETLEPAEICSQQATGCWNGRKFVASEQQGVGTGGNSLPVSNKALEPAEIPSPRTTEHWNLRKFVHSEQRGVVTVGNLFPACNGTLELVENKREFYEVKLGKQGFALRPKKNSK